MPGGPCAAEEYHRLTKYSEESIQALPGIDWSLQPVPYKEIVSDHRIALRPYARAARTRRRHPLAALGDLLFHGNGVTGMVRLPNGEGHFLRSAPSAGALYPTEVYVALGELEDARPGLYNYQVRDHQLVQLWDGDHLAGIRGACGDDGAFEGADACVLLTGVFWRSAWRYQERGYRRVLLDTGHVLANLLAQAPHAGYEAAAMSSFVDDALNGLFFFDGATEGALACVALRSGAAPPSPLWDSGTTPGEGIGAIHLDGEALLKESATGALHRASSCSEPRPVAEAGGAPPVSDRSIRLPPSPKDVAAGVSHAIANRRSARGYKGKAISAEELGGALRFAFGGFATRNAGLLRAHLVAHRVKTLDAGVYEVEGAGEALLPLALGDTRERVRHVSLGQEIAERCAAVLFLSAPAKGACSLYGDRAYRYLHMEAGAIGERFQLAATALGLSACGIAGFFDDQAAALIGIPAEDFVLYLVTIGKS